MNRSIIVPAVVAIVVLVTLAMLIGGGGNTAGPAPGLRPTETATPAGT